MLEFAKTRIGKTFLDVTLPRIATALEAIAARLAPQRTFAVGDVVVAKRDDDLPREYTVTQSSHAGLHVSGPEGELILVVKRRVDAGPTIACTSNDRSSAQSTSPGGRASRGDPEDPFEAFSTYGDAGTESRYAGRVSAIDQRPIFSRLDIDDTWRVVRWHEIPVPALLDLAEQLGAVPDVDDIGFAKTLDQDHPFAHPPFPFMVVPPEHEADDVSSPATWSIAVPLHATTLDEAIHAAWGIHRLIQKRRPFPTSETTTATPGLRDAEKVLKDEET